MKMMSALILVTALAVSPNFSHAENAKKHRVVFDVSVNEKESLNTLLRNITNLRKAFGPDNVEIEVVAYAKGLDLLAGKEGDIPAGVDKLATEGVNFVACANTLNARQLTQKDLLPKSQVVDSGVAELVRRQEEGWSYIKLASYPDKP